MYGPIHTISMSTIPSSFKITGFMFMGLKYKFTTLIQYTGKIKNTFIRDIDNQNIKYEFASKGSHSMYSCE
jgi:hypothetical protein